MMIEASSLSNDKQQQFTIGNSYNDQLKYKLVARSVDIQHYENFPQGCLFSPDGLCVLTATVGDSKLRLYNTPASLLVSTSTDKGTVAEEKSASDASTTNPDAVDHGNKNDENNEAKIQDTDDSVEENLESNGIVEEWKTALTTVSGDSVRFYAWYVPCFFFAIFFEIGFLHNFGAARIICVPIIENELTLLLKFMFSFPIQVSAHVLE
jgi:hypothetical protein